MCGYMSSSHAHHNNDVDDDMQFFSCFEFIACALAASLNLIDSINGGEQK